MKKLLLMRHGKSSWESPVQDRDRELIARGRADAQLVAGAIKDDLPEELTIWSSTAERAASTAVIAISVWGMDPDVIRYREDLYTFEKRALTEIVRHCDESVTNLMIFGHNPAITDFVNYYGDMHIANVPTSGFICIEIEGMWQDLHPGRTTRTVFPKQLKS
jgi:phosphohistidine phosphatase